MDLETGKDKYAIPSGEHYRLNRKLLRQLLSTEIPINWGKTFRSFESSDNGVTVHFSDGTYVEGSMLLGVDGKNSRVKRLLIGEEQCQLNPLPVAFMGLTLRLSPEKMQPFRDIHPVIWQGCHPKSGYFVFFSMLSTPQHNGSADTADEYYEGQFNMSWLNEQHGEAPKTPAEQVAKAKSAATASTGMFPLLKEAILGIPNNAPALEIKLEDWPAQTWPTQDGRIALLGDAAHTMTMCEYNCCYELGSIITNGFDVDRGEAANHGMYDAAALVHQLCQWRNGQQSRQQALENYQMEMIQRTYEAVILSRVACLEVHRLDKLQEDSAVFRVSGFNARVREERAVFDFNSKQARL